ncbi:MAG: hydantoinase B/oxoprolinase family protein, partial [Proteobacteria bacterium]|nr:hydantoinase B/oxoprolinase family protein [Pseudomonadota bacterium]
VPPYGLQGGEAGAPFRVTIRKADGGESDMPGKANIRLQTGDVVVVDSCGGGGYGPPGKDEQAI